MQNEVHPHVLEVVERIRQRTGRLGVTEVIQRLGISNARDLDVKFEYAWRLPGGGRLITIWTEDVRVHPATGRWFYVDTLDTLHRRGGGERSPRQLARAITRVQILREAHQGKEDCVVVLQINKLSIGELEQNQQASVDVRVKDEEHWHVAAWDESRQRVILVRGAPDWMPTEDDIAAVMPGPAGEAVESTAAGAVEPRIVFPDQAHRDQVEAAAMAEVTREYERRRLRVQDVSARNLGYDLLVTEPTSGCDVYHIEVKGTSMDAESFFLTRNERRCAAEVPTWRLAIVTSALTDPQLQIYTAQDMEQNWSFEALVWKCDPH